MISCKVALLSAAANKSSNCSIADRADIIETHHAIGVIADDTVGAIDRYL